MAKISDRGWNGAPMILTASDRLPMGIEREVPDPARGDYVDHFARYHVVTSFEVFEHMSA